MKEVAPPSTVFALELCSSSIFSNHSGLKYHVSCSFVTNCSMNMGRRSYAVYL